MQSFSLVHILDEDWEDEDEDEEDEEDEEEDSKQLFNLSWSGSCKPEAFAFPF